VLVVLVVLVVMVVLVLLVLVVLVAPHTHADMLLMHSDLHPPCPTDPGCRIALGEMSAREGEGGRAIVKG